MKTKTAKDILTGKFPERVLEKAVERMLPEGPLGRQVLKKLHIYAKAEHPHAAQNPVLLDFASRNAKNKKRS
ncbi:hypothetical protein AGMMS50296_8950 [Alphaproteobacteria bacterium]|nr:hypothetical protein AGMMS50296_8950 [Alphaproteobacteria bacterium]